MSFTSAPAPPGRPSQLATKLGFINVKISPPAAVPLSRFAADLFFRTYTRPDLFCVMTADHIEHGFHVLAQAVQGGRLSELQRLLDHIFIFAFCNIIVGDGQPRAHKFLARQAAFSSFDTGFIDALRSLHAEEVDDHPEIAKFLMKPCTTEFSKGLYENLNRFSENQIPGTTYLLRHFLHDGSDDSDSQKVEFERDNGYTNLADRTDHFTLPFREPVAPPVWPNRPRVGPAPTPKHANAPAVFLPTLTALTVPPQALVAAMDGSTTSMAYAVENEIFYLPLLCRVDPLRPHLHAVSAIAFSTCGKFLLSGDVGGNVRIQSLSNGTSIEYEPMKEAITALGFEGPVFAVGSLSGVIHVYETEMIRAKRILLFHTAGITFLSIHPNLEYLASASMDGLIRLHSVTLGTCVRVWKFDSFPLSCRFSHSGKLLLSVSSSGTLTLTDLGANKVLRNIEIQAAAIDAVFSPNDEVIATTDKKGGFSLWETFNDSGESLTVLRITRIRPLALAYLTGDEVKVLGCATPHRVFDDGIPMP
jgi:WD40 repeat protein